MSALLGAFLISCGVLCARSCAVCGAVGSVGVVGGLAPWPAGGKGAKVQGTA